MDEKNEEIILSLNPRNAGPTPKIYYARTPQVSEADTVAEDLETFRTKCPTLYFLTIDTTGEHECGEPVRWVARLKIRHQVHDYTDHREVELKTTPDAIIRYTLDGTNPREGRVYEGPIIIADEKVLLQVYASAGEATEQHIFNIPEKGQKRAQLDEIRPAKLVHEKVRLDTTDKVFDLISTFRGRDGITFHGVTLNIGEGEQALQVRFNDRAVDPEMLNRIIDTLRENLCEPNALIQVNIRDGASFGTGFDLKTFAEIAGINLTPEKVEQ
jgi:hypothetical protein